jgi:hypothetical protein
MGQLKRRGEQSDQNVTGSKRSKELQDLANSFFVLEIPLRSEIVVSQPEEDQEGGGMGSHRTAWVLIRAQFLNRLAAFSSD